MKFVFGLVFVLVLFSACSTIPVTSGTQGIDSMLTDGSLDPVTSDTSIQVAQKERMKKVLTQARSDIVREEESRITAESESRKSSQWAGVGKGLTAAGIIIGILFIVGLVIKITGKIPFV
jgi:hypothetical protein